MRRESAGYLYTGYEAIWRALGASAEEAGTVARCTVSTDLAGKDTQGIAAIPLIYRSVRRGATRFGMPITIVKDGPAFAVVDGGRGPGMVVATRGMEIAIRKAREATVGCVWVRNTNEFAMAASYSTMALEQDYFGLAMSNGVPCVSAWGGRDQVFNTNPLSFAIPARAENPIVFDGAMSSVSHGHVVLAARDRLRMPGNPLIDEAGHVTDDPVPIILDPYDRNSEQLGAILPLGPKGFGWLILVDVLAAIMSGMSTANEIPFNPTSEKPWTGGFFLMAINIGDLVDLGEFKSKVDALIRNCKGSRLADGFREIVMPGERAQREAERRRREGIPIRDEDWANLSSIAGELGIDLEGLRKSASAEGGWEGVVR